jgi:hypothetical protein
MIHRLSLLLAVLIVGGIADTATAVVFTTGTHVIDTDLFGAEVEVNGDAHVTFADGAKAYRITVRDNATLMMTGGQLMTSIEAEGGTSYITGGVLNTLGVLTSGIFAHGTAYVEMSNVSVDAVSSNGGTFNILSGAVQAVVWAEWNGTMNIFGGQIDAVQGLEVTGVLNIYGGTFGENAVLLPPLFQDGGSVNIYGSGFNYPFGVVPDQVGTVTGLLADGSSISLDFLPPDLLSDTQPLTISLLPIPEPSTIALLVSGLLCLAFLHCRRAG